jgi:hypothetical protein
LCFGQPIPKEHIIDEFIAEPWTGRDVLYIADGYVFNGYIWIHSPYNWSVVRIFHLFILGNIFIQ